MASWVTNAALEYSTNNGSTWTKLSDHGREPLSISVERIESKQRMANGTLRRYVVAKKRSISITWNNIPSKSTSFLANGTTGGQIEELHDTMDGDFLVRLRAGSDRDIAFTGTQGNVLTMMISDFSKDIAKRGPAFDLLNISMTLEEV